MISEDLHLCLILNLASSPVMTSLLVVSTLIMIVL